MSEVRFEICAVDTLMFRDGRPFNQGDAGASVASSVFPPYPPTIVGALRAMFWNAIGDWNAALLGTGTNWQVENKHNTLKPLKFGPPILTKAGMPVFPVPLHVVEGGKPSDNLSGDPVITFLTPDASYETDLGSDTWLPAPEQKDLEGIKTISDHWVTLDGMKRILSGQSPEKKHFVKISELWETEPRVGIGINRKSRNTTDGKLYMASHIRMADDVSLTVGVSGLSDDIIRLSEKGSLRPVAGEHRMANITQVSALDLPPREISANGDRVCVIAISPIVPLFDKETKEYNIPGISVDDIVSACLGKPISIGGWNSQRKQPIPLKNCIPTGSVWFLKEGSEIPNTIGASTDWGFGQILIGKW